MWRPSTDSLQNVEESRRDEIEADEASECEALRYRMYMCGLSIASWGQNRPSQSRSQESVLEELLRSLSN